ncbi:MAG: hypothetical protein WBL28_11475 [Methylotenera sp.]
MTNDNVTVYAQFLAQCKEVMGSYDLERLAYDETYKKEFFNSIKLSADDQLFQMAALVDRQLSDEMLRAR